MLRRRVSRSVTADGVPVALTDADDPAWASEEATLDFLAALELDARPRLLQAGPVTRRARACEAWARTNGVTRTVGWGDGVALDWPRMRDLGIHVQGTARERLRRLNSG